MLNIINRTKKQTGDTLVEVMISIAIVALAIAIAYAISGKNLNVGITARERNQALGLTQGQIERMTEALQIDASALAGLNNPSQHFCFNVNNITDNTHQTNGVVNPSNNLTADAGLYSGNCVSNGKYYLDINYIPRAGSGATASGNSFIFTARWYRAGGGADQIVNIYYRPW